jgi:hypothetical protein
MEVVNEDSVPSRRKKVATTANRSKENSIVSRRSSKEIVESSGSTEAKRKGRIEAMRRVTCRSRRQQRRGVVEGRRGRR